MQLVQFLLPSPVVLVQLVLPFPVVLVQLVFTVRKGVFWIVVAVLVVTLTGGMRLAVAAEEARKPGGFLVMI